MKQIFPIPYVPLERETYLERVQINFKQSAFHDISERSGQSTFVFKNCNFSDLELLNDNNLAFNRVDITFLDCAIKNLMSVSVRTSNITLRFMGCIISGRIDENALQDLTLTNCICPSLFILNQKNVFISNSLDNLDIVRWTAVSKSIGLKKVIELLDIEQKIYVYYSNRFTIYDQELKNQKVGYYKNLNSGRAQYKLNEHERKRRQISISVTYSQNNQSVETIIKTINLRALTLTGPAYGKILIENVRIDNFYIHNFSSAGDISFYNISTDSDNSKFEVNRSNLDNAWFDNISLERYSIVVFHRSKLANATFTSCTFPKYEASLNDISVIENVHYPDAKSDSFYKDQYEIFLQLKISLERTGNFHEAQKLNALAKKALKKVNDLSWWDKQILNINQVSNRHNLSIANPLVGFVASTIVLYILYLLAIGRIFNGNNVDLSLIGDYFSFIDITHKSDFLVAKSDFNFGTKLIDFLNKVVAGFFLYQFVVAFRKYSKR